MNMTDLHQEKKAVADQKAKEAKEADEWKTGCGSLSLSLSGCMLPLHISALS